MTAIKKYAMPPTQQRAVSAPGQSRQSDRKQDEQIAFHKWPRLVGEMNANNVAFGDLRPSSIFRIPNFSKRRRYMPFDP
jgi:hypothetical protein